MISRIANLLKTLNKASSALFLGARGLGKTKLSESWLAKQEYRLAYNLLDSYDFKRLLSNPSQLEAEVKEKLRTLPPEAVLSVFIDEVQKVPDLLNSVHLLIEQHKNRVRFLLTGSSARKLKANGANILASRALSIRLHPFTSYELKDRGFNLLEALRFGTVPAIITAEQPTPALRAYVDTYLKEEIQQEALVRKLDKFFSFIDVAAQLNGEVVNFSKMARQLSLADKTIGDYFQILIDTLLVIKINGWDRSAKKQIIKSPKFYFFDCGVLNAAAKELNLPLEPGTPRFGRLFETFVITEIYRLNDYFSLDYALSFYSTGASEVDLVLSRSRSEQPIAVEIESNSQITREDLPGLELFSSEYPDSELFCLSTNSKPYSITLGSGKQVKVLPFEEGILAVLKLKAEQMIMNEWS
jgi:predicted AAA+ superfamily ATPase